MPNNPLNKKVRWIGITTALVGTSLVAYVAFVALTSVSYYPPGKDIVYDDFGFTATRGTAALKVGTIFASPGKCFYVVRARVTNNAKRVDFEFRPEIVKLYTPGGAACINAIEAQSALDAQLGKPQMANVSLSPRGDLAERDLVFEGPAGLQEVRVAFSTAGAIGDFLDALIGGNINVKLPVH